MTNTGNAEDSERTDVRISLIGGTRLEGQEIHSRTLTASLVGGADIDLTDVEIPDGAELRITKLSLVGGVHLRVRPEVKVVVTGIRLGGVSDDGPTVPNGPTVHVAAWGLVGGVRVDRD
ncbi:hypothetical protein [Streptomyces sp. TLI_171]|uniref:hypothetical protein n=1 Tax=Streptomyces sp. TLI_171 TaxID=1938859 RepID=UPI000C18F9BE|nr:hypothetical protein [Streptomyces sp. TLI_171]RKE23355.1 hypothetical protein BX266_6820 [Streptomyces sp. TLI_171]